MGLYEVEGAGKRGKFGLDFHDFLTVFLTFDIFINLVGDGFDGVK